MTAVDSPLTRAQHAALVALAKVCDSAGDGAGAPAGSATPRAIALTIWPDSPAWGRRARRHDGRPGGNGATMPMKAASMMWKLHERGLATLSQGALWSVTPAGRKLLAEVR